MCLFVRSWDPDTSAVLPYGLIFLGAWANDQTSAWKLARDPDVLRLLASSASSSKSPDPAVLLAFPTAANDGSSLEMRSVPLSKVKSEDAAVPVEISVLVTPAQDTMSWMSEAKVQTIRCGALTIGADSHNYF